MVTLFSLFGGSTLCCRMRSENRGFPEPMARKSLRRGLSWTLVWEVHDHRKALGNRLMLHVLYFVTESKVDPGASSLLAGSGDFCR
jgi:hypothetical protein